MKRSCYCGRLRRKDVGLNITAQGWVQSKRDMGGVIFLDLRDREGVLQVVCDAALLPPEQFAMAEHIKNESVITAQGLIRLRSAETYNPSVETGEIELAADTLELLSPAQTLPISIDDRSSVRDELRLKYRFLDLRRPSMLKNLRLRQSISFAAQSYLQSEGFIEVETPMLTKSTPEGARDYLVPSRVHPGSFYALPQSPQLFKQLLMIGGIDRYYQIARCFRDEDLRADRQPEFTQVDMEMSFVDQEDILIHLETMFTYIFSQVMGFAPKPFVRMTWQQAMDTYGTDKPDIRFDLPITDVTDIAGGSSFSVFENVCKSGGRIRAVCIKKGALFSRSTIDELTQKAISYGAKGMAWINIRPDGRPGSILTKYFTKEHMHSLLDAVSAQPDDLIIFCADTLSVVRSVLGRLRLDIAHIQGLAEKDDYRFLFVTDFPMFEYSQTEQRYIAMHHPFTMPYPQDLQYIKTRPELVRSQAFDVVLNGTELGSGSMRIHRRDIQQTVFEALGFTEAEIRRRFGFFVDAFNYGAPPHGGFAFGLDRLTMLLCGASSLRDVIAFPKLKDASCPMTEAPSFVDPKQLAELSLSTEANGAQSSGNKSVVCPEINIEHIAALSKLELPGEKKAALSAALEETAAFASELCDAPAGNKETEHIAPLDNVMRPDIAAAPSISRKQLLACAPEAAEEYISVPRVMQ